MTEKENSHTCADTDKLKHCTFTEISQQTVISFQGHCMAAQPRYYIG